VLDAIAFAALPVLMIFFKSDNGAVGVTLSVLGIPGAGFSSSFAVAVGGWIGGGPEVGESAGLGLLFWLSGSDSSLGANGGPLASVASGFTVGVVGLVCGSGSGKDDFGIGPDTFASQAGGAGAFDSFTGGSFAGALGGATECVPSRSSLSRYSAGMTGPGLVPLS
jgi:hypothetical protein